MTTQKFASISPLIRVNASELYVFRLRNSQDLETFLNELGAICGDKKSLMKMYTMATDAPFSFLYCRLTQKDKNDNFMINYNKKLIIDEGEG